jgi:hypothetical protein
VWGLAYPSSGYTPYYSDYPSRRLLQLDTITYVLAKTYPDARVFDGMAMYVFRPAACRCWSLGFVTGESRIDSDLGCTPGEIINCLSDVRLVIEDKRVKKMANLSPQLRQYLEENYNPPDELGVRIRKG